MVDARRREEYRAECSAGHLHRRTPEIGGAIELRDVVGPGIPHPADRAPRGDGERRRVEEIVADGYRIKILKMNSTLPELVELKALELEKK